MSLPAAPSSPAVDAARAAGFGCAVLPRPAPARVLACGAFLKNTACLIEGDRLWTSPQHGDLSEPDACAALEASAARLLALAGGPVQALAHDTHPDFFSTRLAQGLAAELCVPAIAVQHHRTHGAVVQAEHGVQGPLLTLALDGVGLGSDGSAWGGELLWLGERGGQGDRSAGAGCGGETSVAAAVEASAQASAGDPATPAWQRLDHLPALALPGGDVAAREPWRMAAAALHAAGLAQAIAPRFGPLVGEGAARLLAQMLARGLNCPATTAAGRWFDAAAGLLGLSLRQTQEAEAAIALERAASGWLARQPRSVEAALLDAPELRELQTLPLDRALLALVPILAAPLPMRLTPVESAGPGPVSDSSSADLSADAVTDAIGRRAALFHLVLAQGLVRATRAAAAQRGVQTVALGGGCFFNALLSRLVEAPLRAAGLRVLRPEHQGCGDAGLALGQAWIAAATVAGAHLG